MGFGVSEAAKVLQKLIDYGVEFVVIGDTVVQLALGRRVLEGDIDLFTISPSVIVEEEKFIEIAEREGWTYAQTEAGTPRLEARVDGVEVPIDLYENIFDIYVPEKIIAEASERSIGGARVRIIKLEDYIVLKARQGVDLEKLSRYISKLRSSIDVNRLSRIAKLFPPDEEKLIKSRLVELGLKI